MKLGERVLFMIAGASLAIIATFTPEYSIDYEAVQRAVSVVFGLLLMLTGVVAR